MQRHSPCAFDAQIICIHSCVPVAIASADPKHALPGLQPVLPQPKDNAGLANTDLSTKIRCFFRSSAHADIQLRAGSEVFPAHKIVLAAQSPTFERMFESGMVEQVIFFGLHLLNPTSTPHPASCKFILSKLLPMQVVEARSEPGLPLRAAQDKPDRDLQAWS